MILVDAEALIPLLLRSTATNVYVLNPIVEVSIDREPDKGRGGDSPIPGTIFTETQLLVLHLNMAGQFFCTVVGDIEIVAVPFGGGGGG
jgi:hypothetical protein